MYQIARLPWLDRTREIDVLLWLLPKRRRESGIIERGCGFSAVPTQRSTPTQAHPKQTRKALANQPKRGIRFPRPMAYCASRRLPCPQLSKAKSPKLRLNAKGQESVEKT